MNRDPQQANGKVIEVKGLKKSFNRETILNGIDLNLRKGENLVILGKSGTGKSVLIKCIVRLIEPDAGSMHVLGRDVIRLDNWDLTEYRRKIGFLFQGGALYDSMSVKDNLMFPLQRSGTDLSREEMEERVHEMLQSVNLEGAINKWPAELSGGMKNRIALARTLILRPEIIFYDEPTSGLDAVTTREISQLIREKQESHNVSSIIITHDLACLKITSDRINVIRDGKIIDEGNYEELSVRKDPWVRAFFEE